MGRTHDTASKRRGSSRIAAVILTVCVYAGGGQEGTELPAVIERAGEDSNERPLGRGDCTGKGGASIRAGGEELFLPLDELELIRREVERFLAEEDPELDPAVFAPGEAFVDCEGVARMGAWILESGGAPNELSLTFRIHTSEIVIVRQIVALERRGEVWRATGVDRQIAHLRH